MQKNRENPFINLTANILLPVIILNKTSLFPGDHKALYALLAALAFPIGYGVWDLIKNSKVNLFSILGLINTLITGLFALLQLGGIWFAIKEASLPLLLGVGTFVSSLRNKPFFKSFINSSGLLNMEKIWSHAETFDKTKDLEKSFVEANNFFGFSFLVSAFLNFALAIYIFKPFAEGISSDEKAALLNQQISNMTWAGFLIIGLPVGFFLAFTLVKLFKDIQKHTGLTQDEIINLK